MGNVSEAKPPSRRKRGRPLTYTFEKSEAVLRRIEAGHSLATIAKTPGMPPPQTVCQWATDNVCGFAGRYAQARDRGLDVMADQLLEFADNVTAETAIAARVTIDTKKWYLSKLAPKRYGDKLIHEGGDTPITISVQRFGETLVDAGSKRVSLLTPPQEDTE